MLISAVPAATYRRDVCLIAEANIAPPRRMSVKYNARPVRYAILAKKSLFIGSPPFYLGRLLPLCASQRGLVLGRLGGAGISTS